MIRHSITSRDLETNKKLVIDLKKEITELKIEVATIPDLN